MKIAFFTEGRYSGKVPVDHPNMRTDLAWQYYLNSDHYCLHDINGILDRKYDLGIIIIPKNNPGLVYNKLDLIHQYCGKVASMQEGPADFWTDYTMQDQLGYLGILNQMDFLLCHNICDISYFQGLIEKKTYVLQPVIVHENIEWLKVHSNPSNRHNVIIGGNACKWYNGLVSFIIAKRYADYKIEKVWAPSMGRKIPGEEKLDDLNHLRYMPWSEWMRDLSNFKFAVHMMPTVAAGTFSLNCAYFGIPCIGNELVDTQRNCHRIGSVNVNDIKTAKDIATFFSEWDDETYNTESQVIKDKYNNYYHPDVFKKSVEFIFDKEM